MSTTQLLGVVFVVVLSVCQASPFFPFFMPHNNMLPQPRCSAASKPCRIRAVLEGGPAAAGPQVISNQPCSCPDSKACSDDWEGNRDRVIVRELVTDGNINMTLSIMFCNAVQPQRLCTSDDVALQLTGLSHIPTEVDFIACTCADPRPMVLDRKSYGADHQQYHAFVCANHKRRCNIYRRNRDTCLVTNTSTLTVSYPCKCPSGTSCRAPRYNTFSHDFTCMRTWSSPRSG